MSNYEKIVNDLTEELLDGFSMACAMSISEKVESGVAVKIEVFKCALDGRCENCTNYDDCGVDE